MSVGSSDESSGNSRGFASLVGAAFSDPTVRGKSIWFPEKVIDEYGLAGPEAEALRHGSIEGLQIDDPELRRKAELVFNLHDLHSGE